MPLGRYGEEGVEFVIGGLEWVVSKTLAAFGDVLLPRDDGMDVRTSCASIVCLLEKLTRSA